MRTISPCISSVLGSDPNILTRHRPWQGHNHGRSKIFRRHAQLSEFDRLARFFSKERARCAVCGFACFSACSATNRHRRPQRFMAPSHEPTVTRCDTKLTLPAFKLLTYQDARNWVQDASCPVLVGTRSQSTTAVLCSLHTRRASVWHLISWVFRMSPRSGPRLHPGLIRASEHGPRPRVRKLAALTGPHKPCPPSAFHLIIFRIKVLSGKRWEADHLDGRINDGLSDEDLDESFFFMNQLVPTRLLPSQGRFLACQTRPKTPHRTLGTTGDGRAPLLFRERPPVASQTGACQGSA